MLTEYSVKKPFSVVVIMIIILILGIVSYTNTSVDLFPNMNMPYVVVATVSIGSAPEAVEENVTIPVEEQLSTLDNVKNITSMSMENISMVVLEYKAGTDIDTAIPLIREALAVGGLTSEVSDATSALTGSGNSVSEMTEGLTLTPIIVKINPSMLPVMMVAMGQEGKTSQESNETFSKLIEEIKSVEGVSSVSTSGIVEQMILMQFSTDHLMSDLMEQIIGVDTSLLGEEQQAEFDELLDSFSSAITPELLNTLIAAQNLEMPAGAISEDGLSYFIKVGEAIESREDLYNTPLFGVDIGDFITTLDAGKIDNGTTVSFSRQALIDALTTIHILDAAAIEGVGETVGLADGLLAGLSTDNTELAYRTEVAGVLYLTMAKGSANFLDNQMGWELIKIMLSDKSAYIKLGNVTDIYELDTSGQVLTSLNGKPTVTLTITKQPDYSTADVSKAVLSLLDEYSESDEAEGFFYVSLFDQGYYINEVIKSLLMNMIYGAIFAVIVLFLFIPRIKPTLLITLSIGISIVATFVLMYFAGISLNIVSMGGLALGVGMLVDNSIVVLENIFRHRAMGKNNAEAAVSGTKEVAGAITSSTLTTIIVFLPLAFVKGLVKEIFADMAITIAFSLLASLIFAITLIPMATTTKFFKKEQQVDLKWVEKLKVFYKKCLTFALNKKWVVIATVVVLFATSVASVFFMGMEIFPTADAGSLSLNLEFNMDNIPEGENYQDVAEETVDMINEKVLALDYVETIGISESSGILSAVVGDMGSDVFSSASTSLTGYIILADRRKISDSEAAEEIYNLLKSNDGLYELTVDKDDTNSSMSALMGDNIELMVFCNDTEDLADATGKIAEAMKGINGISEVTSSLDDAELEYKLILDKDKASEYGVYVGTALLSVMNSLSSDYVSTNIKFKGDYDSTMVSIYPSSYTITEWIKAADINGNKVSVFFNADDSAYLINNSGSAIILKDNTNVPSGGKIPLSISENSYSYILQDNTVIIYTAAADGKIYYSIDSNEVFNLVTVPVSVTQLGSGTDITGGSSTVTVPLWKLLDDSCFIKDGNGNTITVFDAGSGENIPIGIQKTYGQITIMRENKNRYMSITATISEDGNVGDATKDVEKIIAALNLQDGVSCEFGGQSEMVDDIFDTVYLVLALGIVLIYLVMVAQFQSLKSPFIVMFTIPLAFTGGIISLIIFGMNLSASALLGLVVLVGIVVNNGIVFVDYANQLIKGGMDIKEALIKTGTDRLRPILMTALTTIFAMISMAFDNTEMGAMIRPMAITAMGGLTYSTILTLFFVPVMYELFNKKRKNRKEGNIKEERDQTLLSGNSNVEAAVNPDSTAEESIGAVISEPVAVFDDNEKK